MKTVVWNNKRIERKKLLKLFREKAADPPIPDLNPEYWPVGYDYEWQEYCIEIRELQKALKYAGVAV